MPQGVEDARVVPGEAPREHREEDQEEERGPQREQEGESQEKARHVSTFEEHGGLQDRFGGHGTILPIATLSRTHRSWNSSGSIPDWARWLSTFCWKRVSSAAG